MTGHETTSAGPVGHAAASSHGGHGSHGAGAGTAPTEELFSRNEIEQFDADDVNAGGTIGKMLALFFLYTVIVMSGVAWWTAHAVKGP